MMRLWVAACMFLALASNVSAQGQKQGVFSNLLKGIEIQGSSAGAPQSFLINPTLMADPTQRVCNIRPGDYDSYLFRVANRYKRETTDAGKRKAKIALSRAAQLLIDAYLNGLRVTVTYRCTSDLPLVSSIRTRAGVVTIPIHDIPD